MKKIFLCFVLLHVTFLCAQTPSSLIHFTGSESEYVDDITLDSDGNFIIVGGFNGSIDFDPGPGEVEDFAGTTDLFVVKLNSDGEYLWSYALDGGGFMDEEIAKYVDVDSDGNIFVAGIFNNSQDFDPGPDAQYLYASEWDDVFVIKLTPDGELMWAKDFGGTNSEYVYDMQVKPDGTVYLCGTFNESCDFDPGPETHIVNSEGYQDGYIAVFDSDGNYLWAKTYGTDQSESCGSICLGDEGDFYLSGTSSHDSINLDPGVSDIYHYSEDGRGFLIKMNETGDFLWYKSHPFNTEIAYDNNGFVIIGGIFDDEYDFDPGAGEDLINEYAHGSNFIQKIDSAGNYIWTKTYGAEPPGADHPFLEDILVDEYGNITFTGSFKAITNFDPASFTFDHVPTDFDFVYMTGNYDIYVCRYTPDGEFDNLLILGGDDHDISSGIHPRNEEVIVFGYFRDNVDFDLTDGEMILDGNFTDGFVAAYTLEALDLGTIDEDVNSIVIFPNPTSGDFQILLPEQENYRSIQLINPIGKIIFETPVKSINETININGESGIYFLQIISDTGESFGVKIIKI
jgi:hypothetical protein